MEFLVATNNRWKLAEIKRILETMGHTAVGMEPSGVYINVVEDGETFAENAMKKAKAACTAANRVAIADDSGIEVEALGGAPGILSKRFAGPHAEDEDNNKKLLHLLERTPYAKRGAAFVCSIALVTPDGKTLTAEGRCEGNIGIAIDGAGGFGYDPLFFYEGKSFASMTPEEKDQVSHRARALRQLVEQLPTVGL